MTPARTFLRCLCLLALLPPSVFAQSPSDTPPKRWTAPEAVHQVLEHNPDARAALERIQAADADIRAARAAFYPQLGLSAEYSRTNNPMYSFGNILNQGVFRDGMDFNHPGVTDTLQTKATIQYRLFNGGQDLAALEAAGERARVAQLERDALRGRLAFEAVRAFCTLGQAEETVTARKSALTAIGASLHVAQARHQEGSLLKEDLLNLEVQQARAQEQLIQAEHGQSLARRAFLHLLDWTSGSAAIDPAAGPDQEIPLERDSSKRPERLAMEAVIKAREAMVRQAQAGRYPTTDAFASYQTDKGTELDAGSGNSWSAGVRLNYTLFNGRQTEAAIDRQKAELAEARERQRALTLALNLETEQAVLAMHQEDERLKVTVKMVRLAEESARLARLRFQEGVLLASELIQTENRLTEAQLSHTLATASRKMALADLRRAVGLRQFN